MHCFLNHRRLTWATAAAHRGYVAQGIGRSA